MTDRELLDALTVLARRLGLLDPDERLAVEQVPIPEPALCLAFGTHGEVRLCCTYAKGHVTGDILNAPSAHSWERAMIGKSACIAATKIGASGEWLCQRPSGHVGEHKATTPDGARWTWGDAPRETGLMDDVEMITDSPEIRCKARSERTGHGSYFVCILVNGHKSPHKDVRGTTWLNVEGSGDASDPSTPRA